MNRLVNRVVSSSDLLVAEDVNVTIFSRIWGLVQCTPDITPSDNVVMESKDEEFTSQVVVSSLKVTLSILWPLHRLFPHLLQKMPHLLLHPHHQQPQQIPVVKSSNCSIWGRICQILTTNLLIFYIKFVVAVFVSGSSYFLLTRRARRKHKSAQKGQIGDEISTVESIQFDLRNIEAATNNFSDGSKIGEGGFGTVYKA
ncbi:hypothetical protein ACOSP7_012322 [Xanthoceras sorbifolium]